MKPDNLKTAADKLGMKFHKLHGAVGDIIKKLLKCKNPTAKERVMIWMRKAVSLNMELRKTMTMAPAAS